MLEHQQVLNGGKGSDAPRRLSLQSSEYWPQVSCQLLPSPTGAVADAGYRRTAHRATAHTETKIQLEIVKHLRPPCAARLRWFTAKHESGELG